jgi:hypothetical protein
MSAALAVGSNSHPFTAQGIKTDFSGFSPWRQSALIRGGVSGPRLGDACIVEVDEFPAVGEPGAGDSRHESRPLVVQQINNIVPQSAQKALQSNKKQQKLECGGGSWAVRYCS